VTLAAALPVDPRPDVFDFIVGGAQIVGVAIAAVGAWYVWHQIRDARREARIQRSLAFLQRYAERELRERFSPVGAYLGVTTASACVDHIRAWESAPHAEEPCLPRTRWTGAEPRARKNDVQHVLDFFEELGATYNQGLLDEEVVARSVAPVPVGFLGRAWWFVLWRRGGRPIGDGVRTYAELETMVRAILKERPDLRERFRPASGVSLLVIPQGTPSPGDWERCKRLSEALSERVSEGATGEQLLAGVEDLRRRDGHRDLRVRVIYVPPDLGEDEEAWASWRVVAEELSAKLAASEEMVEA
jgi:hypothetical protein